MSIIDDVSSGQISASDAIRSLVFDLGEIESEIEISVGKLQRERSSLRDQIAIILSISGTDSIKVDGFGSVYMTKPTITKKYDTKKLDRLAMILISQGDHELAQEITACREESERSGYLMIRREK